MSAINDSASSRAEPGPYLVISSSHSIFQFRRERLGRESRGRARRRRSDPFTDAPMALERLRVFTVIHRNRRIEQSIFKLGPFDEQEFPML
jgi:hypothetical protein